MSYDNDHKVGFFTTAIEKILSSRNEGKALDILDVGCNNGDLIGKLDLYFGTIISTHGVDIGAELVKMAPAGKASVGNGYDLALFPSESKDVLLYSSFLHELGSYFTSEYFEKYSREIYYAGIKTGLKAAERVLKQGGFLLIKDPVRPLQSSEILTLKIKDGINRVTTISELFSKGVEKPTRDIDIGNLTEQDLQILDSVLVPNDLHYLPRMALFLKGFQWSHSQIPNGIINLQGDILTFTRDLVADISRHMPWGYSKQSFTDEQKEWYGSLNAEEWKEVLKDTGFEIESHEVTYRKSDHSKLMGNTFVIYDSKGKEIHAHDISPTHHYTVLKKIK
ncbi:methyltransferase domain-containing protein [Candidatus Gracilibacteria bacterium]|nr:methyltransferase domain-containing protein [Candidatus Gracilibacteria bacterium]